MNGALAVLLGAILSAAPQELDNLDFAAGRLSGWQGKGFAATTAPGRPPAVFLRGPSTHGPASPHLCPARERRQHPFHGLCRRRHRDERLDVYLEAADARSFPNWCKRRRASARRCCYCRPWKAGRASTSGRWPGRPARRCGLSSLTALPLRAGTFGAAASASSRWTGSRAASSRALHGRPGARPAAGADGTACAASTSWPSATPTKTSADGNSNAVNCCDPAS